MLFVCFGNACRSQMAEAFANRLGEGAGAGIPVGAPAPEGGGVAEAHALEVIVGHLAHQLGPHGYPFRLPLRPPARAARCPATLEGVIDLALFAGNNGKCLILDWKTDRVPPDNTETFFNAKSPPNIIVPQMFRTCVRVSAGLVCSISCSMVSFGLSR